MATRNRTQVPKAAVPPANTSPNAGDATTTDLAAGATDALPEGEEQATDEELPEDPTPAPVASGLVSVTLVEGEYFGLGANAFVKGVTRQVTKEVADILATKTVKIGVVRAGRGATQSEIPRFKIGTPVVARHR